MVRTASLENELRVLVICAEYPPFVQGGLGVHYKELLDELSKICRVTLIAARISRQAPGKEQIGALTIYRILVPKLFPLNHIFFNIKAWRLSRTLSEDIIHLCAPFGLLCLTFKKLPVAVKIHSLYKGQAGGFLYRRVVFPIAALMDRYMIARADLVMTTSLFMKKSIEQQYGATSVIAIDNGISSRWLEEEKDRIRARTGIGIAKSKYVILNVGRFVPRKGTLRLVEAFRSVHERHRETQLVLIGSGYSETSDYKRQLHDFIDENGLREAVTFVGWIPSEEIRQYYEAADLYVHAATYEPFGNAILEAMARGLPVIAVKAGGPEEIAGESAIILEDNDPGLMATAIEDFIKDPCWAQKYSERSRERAAEFSWRRTAKETLDGYRAILDHYQGDVGR